MIGVGFWRTSSSRRLLLSIATLNRASLAAAVLTSIAASACQVALPLCMRNLLDTASHAVDRRDGAFAVLVLAATACGLIVFDEQTNCRMRATGERIKTYLRARVHAHVHAISYRSLEQEQTGAIQSLCSSEIPAVARLFGFAFGETLRSALQFFGVVILLVKLHGVAALAAPVAVLCFWGAGACLSRRMRLAASDVQRCTANLAARFQEGLLGAREIKAFNRVASDIEAHQRSNAALERAERAIITVRATSATVNGLTYWSIVAVVYLVAIGLVFDHRLTIGSMLSLVLYVAYLDAPVRTAIHLNEPIQTGLSAAERLASFLEKAPENTSPKARLVRGCGALRLDNVSFSYSGNEDVLKGLNLEIAPATRVAIVGPSGAGKTTLVKLLVALYPPTSGRILIDGQDTSGVHPDTVRDHVAAVFQDTFLFRASVLENIRFGRADASDVEVVQAARAANADPFIRALPSGYQTRLGEDGFSLSGGERQRIAIARAMLRDPGILVLDEATAALDSESEALVLDGLAGLMERRTTILISHRLWALKHADVIVVLDSGAIIGSGTHEELLATCDLYRESFDLQCGGVTSPWHDAAYGQTTRGASY